MSMLYQASGVWFDVSVWPRNSWLGATVAGPLGASPRWVCRSFDALHKRYHKPRWHPQQRPPILWNPGPKTKTNSVAWGGDPKLAVEVHVGRTVSCRGVDQKVRDTWEDHWGNPRKDNTSIYVPPNGKSYPWSTTHTSCSPRF